MAGLTKKTLEKRMALLKRVKEQNSKIIEKLLKETKAKDEKISWYRKRLRSM